MRQFLWVLLQVTVVGVFVIAEYETNVPPKLGAAFIAGVLFAYLVTMGLVLIGAVWRTYLAPGPRQLDKPPDNTKRLRIIPRFRKLPKPPSCLGIGKQVR